MKKLFIIHENNDWMPTIREALVNADVAFEEIYLVDRGLIDLQAKPNDGIFWNRISPSAHTRDHYFSKFYALAILDWLESRGAKVINGSHVMNMELSKVMQYNALMKNNILVPRTIAVFSNDDTIKAAKEMGFPMLLKHNQSGKGAGIRKFDTLESLRKYLDSDNYSQPVDGVNLVQQYIDSAHNYIVRLEFINGKFVYAVKIDTEGGFNLCPADSCNIEGKFCVASSNTSAAKFSIIRDFDHAIIDKYEHFLHRHNYGIAGIEYIVDKKGLLYTYDINANTNYNSVAELAAGVSAHKTMASFFRDLCN